MGDPLPGDRLCIAEHVAAYLRQHRAWNEAHNQADPQPQDNSFDLTAVPPAACFASPK